MNMTDGRTNAVMDAVDHKIMYVEGTKPLSTQVAGHHYGVKGKTGMLDTGNGRVLKAVQNPPRGVRELNFYKAVFDTNCQNEDMLTLKNFLPTFHGTVFKDDVTFMVMDNVCSKFQKPSVLDIKIGRVTSDPEASEEKTRYERIKCRYAENLGFQLSGMMIYNENTNSYDRVDKKTCHNMPEESVLRDGLGKFFGLQQRLRKDVIRALISKVKLLEKWFSTQKSFAFYASSLLITYESASESISAKHDGSMHNDSINGMETVMQHTDTHSVGGTQCDDFVDLRFIDFAHVFQSSQIDENVLFGIHYLLKYLDQLLEL